MIEAADFAAKISLIYAGENFMIFPPSASLDVDNVNSPKCPYPATWNLQSMLKSIESQNEKKSLENLMFRKI